VSIQIPGDGRKWTVTSASGLELDVTTRPDSPVLAEFFAGYDHAFVLPDEKEDLDGFKACLALGHGEVRQRLLKRYGPHVEVVLVARDGGKMIGGGNFIAYPVGSLVAGNLNYVFVTPGARGKGYFRRLVAACEELMAKLFAGLGTLTFIELNDPFVLSDEEYRLDSETAGVDQFDRLAIWARLDAKVVDFPYVQPPLSAHQRPDEGLIYAVLGASEASLDPSVLKAHLERFFGISVLKGVEPMDVPVAARQLRALDEMSAGGQRVALLDPAPRIEPGRKLRAPGMARPVGFRQFLRS
jgi:GNAT superfamily N-acetyltransferase